jgi:hypothetical protein
MVQNRMRVSKLLSDFTWTVDLHLYGNRMYTYSVCGVSLETVKS